jgi:predicted nucleic acid binding AN1-type Zn finger protein
MNRCKKCSCKSSFFLKCKCGNEYCTKHILPEIHECIEMGSFRKEAYEKNKKMLIEASKKDKVEWIT